MRWIVFTLLSVGFLAGSANCNAEGAFAFARRPYGGGYWWGVSTNKQTLREARSAAIQACTEGGPNCSVAATFRMVCFALAAPVQGQGYTWATRRTQLE